MSKFQDRIDLGGRTASLGDVMSSWSGYILQMDADLAKYPPETIGDFGFEDYIGALFARNFLERAIQGLQVNARDPEFYLIAAADRLFARLTRDDVSGIVIDSEPEFQAHKDDSLYWWLRRVPDGGALGFETSRVARAKHGLKF